MQRDSHLVKDCHLPAYEDHLGAEELKPVSPFADMRYMYQVVHQYLSYCCIIRVVPRYNIVPLASAEGTFNIIQ